MIFTFTSLLPRCLFGDMCHASRSHWQEAALKSTDETTCNMVYSLIIMGAKWDDTFRFCFSTMKLSCFTALKWKICLFPSSQWICASRKTRTVYQPKIEMFHLVIKCGQADSSFACRSLCVAETLLAKSLKGSELVPKRCENSSCLICHPTCMRDKGILNLLNPWVWQHMLDSWVTIAFHCAITGINISTQSGLIWQTMATCLLLMSTVSEMYGYVWLLGCW